MANRTKITTLIRLITLTTGLVIGGGVSASVVEVNGITDSVIGRAPVVSGVQFDKSAPAVNDKVSATPTITDVDNDTPETSLYQWKLDGVDISGATQNSYKLVPGDGNGKKLTVVVTPQTNPKITEPAIGAMFTSSALTTHGLAPKALDVKIDGMPLPGELLTGYYSYYDGDSPSDLEDTSVGRGTRLEWLCSRGSNKQILATANNYTLQDADIGCALSFNVTPRSRSGTPNTGVQTKSKVVNVTKTVPTPVMRIFNGNQIGARSGSGFNVEIEHDSVYSPIDAIIAQEKIRRWPAVLSTSVQYTTGKSTGSGSVATYDGSTMKFGDNAKGLKGETIYVFFTIHLKNGKRILASTPDIVLQ